jgi:hypothetical protein
LRRDDAEPALRARKRNLDLGVAGEQRRVLENRAHRGRAEGVLEQGGI